MMSSLTDKGNNTAKDSEDIAEWEENSLTGDTAAVTIPVDIPTVISPAMPETSSAASSASASGATSFDTGTTNVSDNTTSSTSRTVREPGTERRAKGNEFDSGNGKGNERCSKKEPIQVQRATNDGSVRITTWNVNGIRNPFAYQPWIELQSYGAMFDTLDADIVIFQELKIQPKDLRDDMVLVPGWDCYFTMPKHKKGYSGVAIYVRTSKVNPIKAEEGITGILSPPGPAKRGNDTYTSLPLEQQIGGYPIIATSSREEALLLDSEGRALVLDFGAFVLIGTYCPAARDSSRDDFRITFVSALFERVRNLVAIGRRVVLAGDLNISRDEVDSAHAKQSMKENGLTDFKDTPTRTMFHYLLEPHPKACMVDLCREYFPTRRGMYTCWEQRIQARPGNYGARIDYALCSSDMRSWFFEANIQEGLMGSDHCPVYAILKSEIELEGQKRCLLDIINPPGMFVNGKLQSSFVPSRPKLSGRLLPEFTTRRNIKDMFMKKPTVSLQNTLSPDSEDSSTYRHSGNSRPELTPASSVEIGEASIGPPTPKRQKIEGSNSSDSLGLVSASDMASKRMKSANAKTSRSSQVDVKQLSLAGFFRPKAESSRSTAFNGVNAPEVASPTQVESRTGDDLLILVETEKAETEIDSASSKESWSKLFTKKAPPKCDGHSEPCKQLTTKKPGPNCGRAFWICSRPVGPDEQEVEKRASEWRCNFFMWSSDWKSER